MNNQCPNLSNFSHLRLNSKCTSTPSSSQLVSKYFKRTAILEVANSPNTLQSVPVSSAKDEQNTSDTECPYESALTSISVNSNTSTGDADFKTPKQVRARIASRSARKVFVKCAKHKRSTKDKKSRQTILTKSLVDGLCTLDVNPEHLQLAIALSRSEQDQLETSSVVKSVDSNRASIAQTLEQFGFTVPTTRLKVQHGIPLQKGKKTSKYKYITPVLLSRTQTHRENLISEKVSLILSKNDEISETTLSERIYNNTVISNALKTYWNKDANIFKLSAIDISNSQSNDIFYVKTLHAISPTSIKCGSLLRDWSTIPGRPASPSHSSTPQPLNANVVNVAKNNSIHTTSTILLEKSLYSNRCISPDLFDSDDETSIEKDITTVYNISLLVDYHKPSEKQNNPTNANLPTSLEDPVEETNMSENRPSSSTESCSKYPIYETEISDLHGSTIIQNTTGILTIESYSKDEINCFDLKYRNSSAILDLTQSSDDELSSSMVISNSGNSAVNQPSSSLNITDYVYSILSHKEEIKDNIYDLPQSSPKYVHRKSLSEAVPTFRNVENVKTSDKLKSLSNKINLSQMSQESIVISDEELNYSSLYMYSTPEKDKFEDLNGKDSDALQNPCISTPKSRKHLFKQELTLQTFSDTLEDATISNLKISQPSTSKCNQNQLELVENVTPKNKVIIKTSGVTPMINYNQCSTPDIQKELTKFGIKPLKRHRGIQILEYIYDSTHPIVDQSMTQSDDEDCRVLKRKNEGSLRKDRSIKKYKSESFIKTSNVMQEPIPDVTKENLDLQLFSSTNAKNVEVLGNLLPEEDVADLIFERTLSRTIPSCKIPLHIVWHNLVSSNPKIQESILLYEPLKVEDLYKQIQGLGYKFHIEDLIEFLDKKCITVKMKQGPLYPNQMKVSAKRPAFPKTKRSQKNTELLKPKESSDR